MLSKKDLIKTEAFWEVEIQNEIFRQLSSYMEANNLNRTQLADKWNVSKGYISQIMNGECNLSIKKLVELFLRIDRVPYIKFMSTDAYYEMDEYIRNRNKFFITKDSHYKVSVSPFKRKHISNFSMPVILENIVKINKEELIEN